MSLAALPIFVKLGGRAVMLIGEGEAVAAKRRLLERAGARIVGEEAEAALAIVVDDEAAVARLKARGVLVNAVDRPELCDFTLPAIVDRDPVIVAVGTGGVSAGLAAALRQKLEAVLPADLGTVARALADARGQIRERWPQAEARRRAIGAALERMDGDVVARVLSAEPEPELFAFTLRSRDPDDLTLRQARALAAADRVYHRGDVPAAILERARADAARIACEAPPAQEETGVSVYLEMAL